MIASCPFAERELQGREHLHRQHVTAHRGPIQLPERRVRVQQRLAIHPAHVAGEAEDLHLLGVRHRRVALEGRVEGGERRALAGADAGVARVAHVVGRDELTEHGDRIAVWREDQLPGAQPIVGRLEPREHPGHAARRRGHRRRRRRRPRLARGRPEKNDPRQHHARAPHGAGSYHALFRSRRVFAFGNLPSRGERCAVRAMWKRADGRAAASAPLSVLRASSRNRVWLRICAAPCFGTGARVAPVGAEIPRLHVVRRAHVEALDEPRAHGGVLDGHHHLDPAMEVARHPVGAGEVHLVLAAVGELEHAPVLEVAVDQRAHLDGLGDLGDPRPQAADAADEQRDLHARLRRAVERLDDVLVDERVHLGDDLRGPPLPRVLGFARDEPEHRLVQPERRDDERVPLRRRAVAGQQVEERRGVFAEVRPRREQREVGVQSRGRRVVVAGREVYVAPQPVLLPPDDEEALGVRLQPEQAVDHVHAALLERARPDDVRLFVEARLQLDDRRHLLARLSAARASAFTIGESPPARYSVCLIASTSGSSAARVMRSTTAIERLVRLVHQHVRLAHRREHVVRVAQDAGPAAARPARRAARAGRRARRWSSGRTR